MHTSLRWTVISPRAREALGFIPQFVLEDDPRPAREQFEERYAHGGGWHPMPGWSFADGTIRYPGDPAYKPIAWARLRDETIYVYDHAWVCIAHKDGTFEVARMD